MFGTAASGKTSEVPTLQKVMLTLKEIQEATPQIARAMLADMASKLPLLIAKASERVPDDGVTMVNVKTVSELSGFPVTFFYDHWKEMPFARKVSKKCLRFEKRGLLQWAKSAQPAG